MNEQLASIANDQVAATHAAYPADVRRHLLELRTLILTTAAETSGVGVIEETLKSGQPAYLTSETKSGSTIRVAPTKPADRHGYAMYVICHTNLLASFRALFGDRFEYDGDRGLLFSVDAEVQFEELRQCVAMALTYHQARA